MDLYFKKLVLTAIIVFSAFAALEFSNQILAKEKTFIYFFGREDCEYCQLEKKFLGDLKSQRSDLEIVYFDVAEPSNREKFNKLAEANNLSKITPLTLVAGTLIQGFNSAETTGKKIIDIIDENAGENFSDLNEILAKNQKLKVLEIGQTCGENQTPCEIGAAQNDYSLKLPFFGIINPFDYSLFALSAILGFVDGFNPCAMWVLVVFLLILLQVGNRKRMWQVAGLFILAEAAMYYLILNVWYKTWDFVGLDYIVTPLVGFLAVGSGGYFIYKYFREKRELVCDVSGIENHRHVENKIKAIAKAPLTILTIFAILGLAFSVNVIEFACSIGIPQAFTKIMEINALSFFKIQFYTLIYILMYMADDFLVFGLALYGFSKFQLTASRYSRFSHLIGGVLMLILGSILIFSPEMLVF